MGKSSIARCAGIGSLFLALAACEDGSTLDFLQKKPEAAEETASAAIERPAATRLVEQDVEAPEVFQKTDSGLWDGRPSLGGVWVAHSDATDPERVIIRNEANGKFVIGALFKRERENPGPSIQVSSDAATALGMLAGQPAKLNVTALQRKEVEQPDPAATSIIKPGPISPETVGAAEADVIGTPEVIEAKPLEPVDPLAAAAAAIEKAEDTSRAARRAAAETVITPAAETAPILASAAVTPLPAPDVTPLPAPETAAVEPAPEAIELAGATAEPAPKPKFGLGLGRGKFLQIGIFSIERNAIETADKLRAEGIVPSILPQESDGKTFWRVIIGPTKSGADRTALAKKVKSLGYGDAYFVKK